MFIVEKYAGYNQVGQSGEIKSVTVICELAVFLNGIWDQYAAILERKGGEAQERERSLIISSIMRIMT